MKPFSKLAAFFSSAPRALPAPDALANVGDSGPRARLDGWENALTGLGTSRDKATASRFRSPCVILDPQTCIDLFHFDDIAARIVAARPKEMFRKGYEVRIKEDAPAPKAAPGQPAVAPKKAPQDPGLAKAFERAATDLDVNGRLLEALIWGACTGGAMLVVGANDGQDVKMPLNEKAIRSIDFFHVVDRRYCYPATYYGTDYGRPMTYWITRAEDASQQALEVHESRLIRFGGAMTDIQVRRRLAGWDLSKLQRPHDKMMAFAQSFQSAGHVVTDMSQGVMGIKGLMDLIAAGGSDELATRMAFTDMNRSNARMIPIDADGETFEYVARALTGLPELLDRFMMLLASAAEMPVTILMGRSAAGMNATGDGDFQAWYDTISSEQTNELLPKLQKVFRLIALAKNGPSAGVDVDFDFRFRPLKEMTSKERADVEYVTAQKDVLYIGQGVYTAEECAITRFGGGEWSPETKIDTDAREKALKEGASFDPFPNDEPSPEELAAQAALAGNDKVPPPAADK